MLKKLGVRDNFGKLAKGYLQLRNRSGVDRRVDVFQEKSVFLEQSSTTSMQKQRTDPLFSQTLAGAWTHMAGGGRNPADMPSAFRALGTRDARCLNVSVLIPFYVKISGLPTSGCKPRSV